MVREKIILSDLDLKILDYIQKERVIKDVSYEFNMTYSMIKTHLDRLEKLLSFDKIKYGNFRKILINNKGKHILKLIWEI